MLAMSPIVLFLASLLWIWRRRPALLGPLAGPLLAIAGSGIACLLFLSYEFFGTTERYEGDYISLLLLAAVAAWLALARATHVRRRWLVGAIGAVLVVWSCLTGLAVGVGELQNDPSDLSTAVNFGSPLSTAIAEVVGHPMFAEISTPNPVGRPETSTNLETNITGFWLTAHDTAEIVVVSPNAGEAALAGTVAAGPALGRGVDRDIDLLAPREALRVFRLPASRVFRLPVKRTVVKI